MLDPDSSEANRVLYENPSDEYEYTLKLDNVETKKTIVARTGHNVSRISDQRSTMKATEIYT